MLALENINVTLGKGSKLERKILNNLNITVQKGEFIVMIGGNGAGKSTVFNVISGFLKPDSGKLMIDRQNVTSESQCSRAQLVSKVMQDPRIGTLENMTVFENMAFALKRGDPRGLRPFFNPSRRQFFQEKLKPLQMGLEDRLDELVSNLSGGQRQALSLTMAILRGSKILLLDEITAALDPKTAETVMRLTAEMIRKEGHTCMMITHNMRHAIEYGDRLLILKDGKFIREYDALEKSNLGPVDSSLY